MTLPGGYGNTMNDVPEESRPRERLEQVGPDALTDAELLAILFRTGSRELNAVRLGEEVIKRFGSLKRLSQASLTELKQVHGVGRVKAIEIKAALELGKRTTAYKRITQKRIHNAQDVVDIIMPEMRLYETETLMCIHLSTKNDVLKMERICSGGMDWVSLNPRDVLRQALREGAHGIILVHNHPSGDPEPSEPDILVTRRLVSAAEVLGIRVLDHVIIGDGRSVSLKERALM